MTRIFLKTKTIMIWQFPIGLQPSIYFYPHLQSCCIVTLEKQILSLALLLHLLRILSFLDSPLIPTIHFGLWSRTSSKPSVKLNRIVFRTRLSYEPSERIRTMFPKRPASSSV